MYYLFIIFKEFKEKSIDRESEGHGNVCGQRGAAQGEDYISAELRQSFQN